MTFNEMVRLGWTDAKHPIACPLCGRECCGVQNTMDHVGGVHDCGICTCECGHSDAYYSYQADLEHLASFPDPAQHVIEVAVAAVLKRMGGDE